MTETLTLPQLDAEQARLILPRFDAATALELGLILIELAKDLPVVINIRTANRTYFHASLTGAQPNNDNWARRKGNTALALARSSMAVGLKNAARGRTLATEGLAEADHADHGGAVPIVVAGVGMVAVCTVSGLPQEDDHRLVVAGLDALLARLS